MSELLDRPADHPLVEPLDEANQELLARVHPSGWTNPVGGGVYDLVVIGGGTAGLVSAAGAAGLGARVALVEKALLGGDCLNSGCVPSKALLRSARAVAEIRRAGALGVRTVPVDVDFGAVMSRMRRLRAGISPHDSAHRLAKAGVDVFLGEGRFSSRRTIEVDGRTLRFNRAVIATGGRATAPPIPGLGDIGYLTNETLFWLTDLPARLLVIGGGPIGSEMAQAFSRFGSRVTIFESSPQLLAREDADAAAVVQRRFVAEGIQLELGINLTRVEARGSEVVIHAERTRGDGSTERLEVAGDRVLVAAGRAPNVDTLGLEAAGVEFTRRGVTVDDHLRTSNSRIFAAGDVCSRFKFTHAADAMARIVIQNALFYGRRKASALVIPWATYTEPEIAHVGLYETQAREAGRTVETITVALNDVDRAVLDDDTDGFVRVHHEKGRILGCTIVSAHAGEMIGEASYAVTHGGSLGQFSATVHPYPTEAEAFRMVGDRYRRSAVTPRAARWLARYFRWTRGGSGL
jgi:pyruvate/2-oxoglutarate dehydrogenase complex dihydrolipoamide dehydrogenase (E3) component